MTGFLVDLGRTAAEPDIPTLLPPLQQRSRTTDKCISAHCGGCYQLSIPFYRCGNITAFPTKTR
jgi:hypothetical protein